MQKYLLDALDGVIEKRVNFTHFVRIQNASSILEPFYGE